MTVARGRDQRGRITRIVAFAAAGHIDWIDVDDVDTAVPAVLMPPWANPAYVDEPVEPRPGAMRRCRDCDARWVAVDREEKPPCWACGAAWAGMTV